MAINSVFVYADGQVCQLVLPVDTEPSNWRRVIRSGSVSAFREPPVEITAATEEFDLRGRMFDGRPIYCAIGFDVKEAYQETLSTMMEWQHYSTRVLEELRRIIDQFIKKEHPNAIVLDQLEGDVPLKPQEIADGLERTQLVKNCVRRLVAVRVEAMELDNEKRKMGIHDPGVPANESGRRSRD